MNCGCVNRSRKTVCVQQQKVGLCYAFILTDSEVLLYRSLKYQVTKLVSVWGRTELIR